MSARASGPPEIADSPIRCSIGIGRGVIPEGHDHAATRAVVSARDCGCVVVQYLCERVADTLYLVTLPDEHGLCLVDGSWRPTTTTVRPINEADLPDGGYRVSLRTTQHPGERFP